MVLFIRLSVSVNHTISCRWYDFFMMIKKIVTEEDKLTSVTMIRSAYFAANTSTSTKAPLGSFSTATAERAGKGWLKNSA